MKLRQLCSVVILLALVAALPQTSWGRGFGGMHGGMGGMRGGMGGMRGGMGGMRGGMGGMGGMRGGMGGMGGMGGGMRGGMSGMSGMGGGMSGMRGGMGGMSGMRSGMGGMSGMRSGMGGMSGMSGMRSGMGGLNGMRSGSIGRSNANRFGQSAANRFPGSAARGLDGGRGATGAMAAAGRGDRPNRDQLGNFLGLPSDAGMHSVAGNHVGLDQRGLMRHPADDLRRHGDYLRRGFRGRDFYSADWYRRYPRAWYAPGLASADMWAAASWDSMNNWLGYGSTQPTYYDYGNNVTYQDGSVAMNGQDMGTSDQYYQQAQGLATAGADAPADDDQQWLPLGVFAMTHDQQTDADLILQLAVNKQGIIRGNYTATLTDDTKPVNGSVDRKTQRAAWTIGDNKDNVIETGIYNLTKDEAPALVHFGKDKTEQWTLVRLKQDEQQQATP